MLKYEKMSLFDAPAGSILVHGCNAQGVWGRGIAAEFKEKFPITYPRYSVRCRMHKQNYPAYGGVGKAFIFPEENGYYVGCLITSFDYADIDAPSIILLQTALALNDFCEDWEINYGGTPIYCNKFNSGLFHVPWSETEKILEYFADKYNLDITVCESP